MSKPYEPSMIDSLLDEQREFPKENCELWFMKHGNTASMQFMGVELVLTEDGRWFLNDTTGG